MEHVKSGLGSFLAPLTFWPNNSLLWAVLCIGKMISSISRWSLPTRSQWQETADLLKISKINKVIGENEKCVFFNGKNVTDFLANS